MMWLIMISLNLMSCQLIQITYAFPNQWPYPYGMLKCWGLLSCISLELNCDIYHLPCFLFAYPLWLRLYICSPGAVLSIRLQQTSSQSTGMLSDVYISQPTSRLFTTLSTMPFNLLFSGFLHHVPYIYAADPYIPLLSTDEQTSNVPGIISIICVRYMRKYSFILLSTGLQAIIKYLQKNVLAADFASPLRLLGYMVITINPSCFKFQQHVSVKDTNTASFTMH